MDLRVGDSKIVRGIVFDAFMKAFDQRGEEFYKAYNVDDLPAKSLMVDVGGLLTKLGYRTEVRKKILDYISDEFSSYISYEKSPDRVNLTGDESLIETVSVKNMFDVPLVFNVSIEDRDNFMEIIYDKTEDRYVNTLSMESVIDSGRETKFKFKLLNSKHYTGKDSILLVIIRSPDLDLLNVISKLPIHISS